MGAEHLLRPYRTTTDVDPCGVHPAFLTPWVCVTGLLFHRGMQSCRLCPVSQDLTEHSGGKWLKIPDSAAGLSQEVGKRQGTCLTQQGEHRKTWLVVVIQKQYEEISCSPVPKIIMTLFLFPQLGYLQACSITCVV